MSSPLQSKTWLETRHTTGRQVVSKTRTAHSLTPSASGTVGTLTMDLALSPSRQKNGGTRAQRENSTACPLLQRHSGSLLLETARPETDAPQCRTTSETDAPQCRTTSGVWGGKLSRKCAAKLKTLRRKFFSAYQAANRQ